MQGKSLMAISSLLFLLGACSTPANKNSSTSSGSSTSDAEKIEPAYIKGMTALHQAALEESDSSKLEQLISRATAYKLNLANSLEHTPTHYIFAVRPWGLALLAWERGGDPELETLEKEDAWDWRTEFSDDEYLLPIKALLENSQPPTLAGSEFRVRPAAPDTKYPNEQTALEFLARTARLAHGASPERSQLEQQWQQRLQQQQQAHNQQQAEFKRRREQIADIDVNPIAEPQLPPVQKYQKDVFETAAMFNERIANARADRERQTAEIMAEYRARVEARNARVPKVQAAYAQLEADIAAYNQQLAAQHQGLQRERLTIESQLPAIEENERRLAVAHAYALVYGAPILKPLLVNGQAKYDAENATLHLLAEFPAVGRNQEITIKLTPGDEARAVFGALQRDELQSSALFAFQDDGSVTLKNIRVEHQQSYYVASLQSTDGFQATAAVEVVLANQESLPKLQQQQLPEQQLVSLDSLNSSQVQLQDPVIKDTEFEAYLRTEQQSFQGDTP